MIHPVIISLINNTLYKIIIFSNYHDNVKLPFSFFEDHSQLCYFRDNKEVAGFLESFMGHHHWQLLGCDDKELDFFLTPKQQDYLEFGKNMHTDHFNHFVQLVGELV